jgi:hypothetical protein
MRFAIRLLVVALLLGAGSAAHAVQITTFEFSGYLTSSRSPGGPTDHQPGDLFWGTIAYDRDAGPLPRGAMVHVPYTFGFGDAPINTKGFFDFASNSPTPDSFQLTDMEFPSGMTLVVSLSFAPGVLSPGAFPAALDPGDFLGGRILESGLGLRGEIDRFEVVPEPSTLALLATAAGFAGAWSGLASLKRRTRHPRGHGDRGRVALA